MRRYRSALVVLAIMGYVALFVTLNTLPAEADSYSQAVFQRVMAATWRIEGPEGMGTGWCVGRSKGQVLLVTAAHVVEGQHKALQVRSGASAGPFSGLNVKVIKSDVEADVAVVQVTIEDSDSIPVLTLQDETPSLGSPCFVIGNPQGVPFMLFMGSVCTTRPLSGVGGLLEGMQAVDFPGTPGFSGAAICDMDGHVFAMLTAGITNTHITLSVPAKTIRSVVAR